MLPRSRSPRRLTITITISAHVFDALADRSTTEGRSLSNLAAFLLECALHQHTPALNASPRHLGTLERLRLRLL